MKATKKYSIPKGWQRLRVGTKRKAGDRFVNCEGRWIKTSDHPMPVPDPAVCSGFPAEPKCYAGVYIRKNA